METLGGVPRGLAFGQSNVDDLAKLLIANDFNAVRLPIRASFLLDREKPTGSAFLYPPQNPEFISQGGQLRYSSYREFLDILIESLAKAKLGVVLEIQWKNGSNEEEELLEAVTVLAQGMCSGSYWNIIGLDVQASIGCWSSSNAAACDDQNWQRLTTQWAQTVVSTCPNWLVFIQGE